MAYDNHLTVSETAKLTGKNRRTIERNLLAGKFPSAVRDTENKRWYIPIFDIEQLWGYDMPNRHTADKSRINTADNYTAELNELKLKLAVEQEKNTGLTMLLESKEQQIKLLENKPVQKSLWKRIFNS
jgi:hypothetical protein